MTGHPFSCLPNEFDGKRVLITGGTKGVGAATLQRFQMSGALVATTARSESSESQSSLIFIKADLGTASGVREVVDRIERSRRRCEREPVEPLLADNAQRRRQIPAELGLEGDDLSLEDSP